MLRRIVLFQFKLDTPDAEIEACLAMMRDLPAQIAEIRGYDVAYNRRGRAERYYVSLVAWFDDEAALERYQAHPANGQFTQRLVKSIAATVIFDADVDGP